MKLSIINKLFNIFNKREAVPFSIICLPGTSEGVKPFFKEGWRMPEDNRQWSVGAKARISVPLEVNHSHTTLYLICKVSTFIVPDKYGQQEVNILVNGSHIGKKVLKSNDFIPIVCTIPNEVLNEREINIVFETPDSISPAELQSGPDPDKLGVCLSFFAIVNDIYFNKIHTSSYSQEFRSLEEYENYVSKNLPTSSDRFIYENIISHQEKNHEQWTFPGYCTACKRNANFNVYQHQGEIENYREQLVCSFCGLKSRQRSLIELVRKRMQTKSSIARIFLYERVGLLFQFFVDQLEGAEIVGSEYLGDDFLSGQEFDGIRHEDALRLSFMDKSFDIVVSCDVFEHVPDIERALMEAYRILVDGGVLYFTVPFDNRKDDTKIRAQFTDSKLEFLSSPVYHGNPVNKNGSLVFYDFSWDILEICRRVGFKDTCTISFWGADNGYLGVGELFVFVAKK